MARYLCTYIYIYTLTGRRKDSSQIQREILNNSIIQESTGEYALVYVCVYVYMFNDISCNLSHTFHSNNVHSVLKKIVI